MKKILLASTFAISAISSTAYSESATKDGAFIQVFGGAAFPSKQSFVITSDYSALPKPVGMYGLGIGNNFKNFSFSATVDRTELQFESTTLTTDSSTTTRFFTFLANAAYNFNTGTRFSPYFGAGAGFTLDSIAMSSDLHHHDNSFVWQVSAGAKYAIYKHLDIFADLRYRGMAESQSYKSLSSMTGGRFIMVATGLTYNF